MTHSILSICKCRVSSGAGDSALLTNSQWMARFLARGQHIKYGGPRFQTSSPAPEATERVFSPTFLLPRVAGWGFSCSLRYKGSWDNLAMQTRWSARPGPPRTPQVSSTVSSQSWDPKPAYMDTQSVVRSEREVTCPEKENYPFHYNESKLNNFNRQFRESQTHSSEASSVRKGLGVILIATNIYLVLTTWPGTVLRLYMH